MNGLDPQAWLDDREPAIPPVLRARMGAALRQASAASLPDRLGEAALSCLRAALVRGDERAAALDLLAADALLTHGAEAAADEGAEAVSAWADRFGAVALGRLLPAGEH